MGARSASTPPLSKTSHFRSTGDNNWKALDGDKYFISGESRYRSFSFERAIHTAPMRVVYRFHLAASSCWVGRLAAVCSK